MGEDGCGGLFAGAAGGGGGARADLGGEYSAGDVAYVAPVALLVCPPVVLRSSFSCSVLIMEVLFVINMKAV